MLPVVTDGVTYAAVESAYTLTQSALSGYVSQVHSSWHAGVSPHLARDLDCRLLVANAAEGGLLSCNFNKTCLMVFQEVRMASRCSIARQV